MDALAPVLDAATGRQVLGLEECNALLQSVGWGVLAVAEVARARGRTMEATPLALPVAYAMHEGMLYVATGPGRKLRALERNPRLCLTVTDVQGFDRWRSVVVVGAAHWLAGGADRAAAVHAFAEQHRTGDHTLDPRDARRLLTARILRIEAEEIHGAARGPLPAPATGEPTASPLRLAAVHHIAGTARAAGDTGASAMQSLRRLVRALRAGSAASTRALGVSSAQLFVLRQIAAAPRQSLGTLAQRTLTSPGTVSEVVARLVTHGYVRRTAAADDRRRAELVLTPRGEELLVAASEPVQERLVAALAALDDADRSALALGLERWIAAAGLGGEAAEMFFESGE